MTKFKTGDIVYVNEVDKTTVETYVKTVITYEHDDGSTYETYTLYRTDNDMLFSASEDADFIYKTKAEARKAGIKAAVRQALSEALRVRDDIKQSIYRLKCEIDQSKKALQKINRKIAKLEKMFQEEK